VYAVRAHIGHRPASPLQEERLEVHAEHLSHGVGDDVRGPGTSPPTCEPGRDATDRARIMGRLAGDWSAEAFTGVT
jgi:hypothetical protein